jgi:hypothetical protein
VPGALTRRPSRPLTSARAVNLGRCRKFSDSPGTESVLAGPAPTGRPELRWSPAGLACLSCALLLRERTDPVPCSRREELVASAGDQAVAAWLGRLRDASFSRARAVRKAYPPT